MPVPIRFRLKKGDITLAEVYKISKQIAYKKIDDKKARMKLDVKSARLTVRRNYEYDPGSKEWKPVPGHERHYKFVFLVSSKPISYKTIDTINIHHYPVTFVFYDLSLGFNSPFKSRTGSFKRLAVAKKGSNAKERIRIANLNIRNMVQPQFIFDSAWVYRFWGILYGPMTAINRPPLKTNPSMIPFFSKHELYIIEHILKHVLTERGVSMVLGKTVKADNT
jgi:hypothetical protein